MKDFSKAHINDKFLEYYETRSIQVLNWFCQHNIKIFFVLQGTCFTLCLVRYPSFEMFITLNVWFDLLLISYLLAILQVPLLLITIGTLCILRCFMLLKSVSILIGLFLLLILSILAGFFYYYKHVLVSLTPLSNN